MSPIKKHAARKSSLLQKSRSKSKDVEYTTQNLPSLRRQRTTAYKRMCKALEVGISVVNDSSQQDMFFSYHQEIKKFASNFEDAHLAILEILDDPESEDSDMQDRFDEMYYKVISIYRSLTKNESCSSHPQPSSLSNVRLPKIQLPTFDGDLKRFPEYIDAFNALIHNATSLSDTEKFHYLISSLSGDALMVVKPFPLSSEHYGNAYAALIARYKCKRELAFTCWREILNMSFNLKDAYEFRKSLDLFEENLCILKSVSLPINHWDFVLVYHILSKLDTTIRRDFEEKHSNTELPSYAQLKEFLHSKCEALVRDTHFTEQVKQNKQQQVNKISSQSAQPQRVPRSYTLIASNKSQAKMSGSITATRPVHCSFCDESHSISVCPEFLKKSIDERMKIATDRNFCFNCLKSSHQLKNCHSVFSCRTCKRKHHSLLHRHASAEPRETVSALVSRSISNTTVLLATAIVQVRGASGSVQSFRALFDTGSQSNFITESAVNRLKLNCKQTAVRVSGLGEADASVVGDVTCSIVTNNGASFELDLHVLSKICGDQPIANLNTSKWSHIADLPLADPCFDIPGPIDLLFAADVFAESLLDEKIKGSLNQPTAFKSIFGWLLVGKTRLASTTLLKASETDMDLCNLQSLPKARLLTADESLCEQKSSCDHLHINSGRYILRFPSEEESESEFVGSRKVALWPFHATGRGRSRDLVLSSQYFKTKHLSLVPTDKMVGGKYCIPHHCVLRPEFATTRLRTVFDSSVKDFDSHSLNDTQLIGPKWQPNIVEILLLFREHSIVFMGDSSQMYRQILVSPAHRDSQCIFWRASPHEAFQDSRFNAVSFGVASSPLLAGWSWATFVAGRISHIQDIAPTECWHHITSGDHPADTYSRWQSLGEILHNPLWWAGPRSYNRGTNFTGARNQLLSFINQASYAKKIEFGLNPPSASHFGGIWETQIRAAKSHFYRVVGNQVLTFKELTTLPIQIEAVLNSRLLCPISSDPNDLSVLPPGHFLTLEPLAAAPDEDLMNINKNRLSRWQLLQTFHQNLWSRWKREYLNSLMQPAKRTKHSKLLHLGSMVIIKHENRAPLHWLIDRVIKLIPSSNGVTRIAVQKTATSGQMQRPLVKLCPLPIED